MYFVMALHLYRPAHDSTATDGGPPKWRAEMSRRAVSSRPRIEPTAPGALRSRRMGPAPYAERSSDDRPTDLCCPLLSRISAHGNSDRPQLNSRVVQRH